MMLYKKKRVKIRRFFFELAAIFNRAAILAAILKKKVDEDVPRVERILCKKNGVKIRCSLGGDSAQTDRQTDKQDSR